MKNIKFKKAYTLAEVLLTMTIWATISVLLMCVYKGSSNYIEKMKVQNVTLEFKRALNSVVTNSSYYPGSDDLGNLKEVKIENIDDADYKIYKDEYKFRGLLLRELDVKELGPFDCHMMVGDKNISLSSCYKGDNGVVWGIPDTDFDKINMVSVQNATGSVYKYLPVTIYPDIKNISKIEDFDRYANVYGIRRDGDVTIINNIDCTDSKYKKYNQCLCAEAVASK